MNKSIYAAFERMWSHIMARLGTKVDRSEIEENDAIEIVAKAGLVTPIAAEDGSVYTDENGAMYSL